MEKPDSQPAGPCSACGRVHYGQTKRCRIVRPRFDTVAVVSRVPTEAMLIAARDWSYAKYGKPIGDDAAIGCWTAMLETATNV